MTPRSVITAHLEGDFINEGKQHLPGTSLHVKAGKLHSPHSTEKGCKILVLWTAHAASQVANLGDFNIPMSRGSIASPHSTRFERLSRGSERRAPAGATANVSPARYRRAR